MYKQFLSYKEETVRGGQSSSFSTSTSSCSVTVELLRGHPVHVTAKLKNLMMEMMSGVTVVRYPEFLIVKPQQPQQQMQVGV